MNRIISALVNFALLIGGIMTIYSGPASQLLVAIGMLMISISIISFTIMIYFPPTQPEYPKPMNIPSKTKTGFAARKSVGRIKKTKKAKQKPKRIRKR